MHKERGTSGGSKPVRIGDLCMGLISRLQRPTHGTKASNCLTLTSNPWNEGFKLSNSHIQPMEQRLQTIQLSHPTHGTKASNHPTPMYNPWHKDLKLASNTHGMKASNHPTPTYNPWNFQPCQMMTGA